MLIIMIAFSQLPPFKNECLNRHKNNKNNGRVSYIKDFIRMNIIVIMLNIKQCLIFKIY